jgi:outer membrane protein TolC
VLEHTNEAELIDLALSNSIAMKEENVNMRISELQEKIVDSMNVPTLSAFFNYDYNYQKTNQTLPVERTWNPSWNAGIQLSWSLDSLIPVVSRNYNSHIEAEKTKNIFEIRRQKAHADIILMVQTFLIDINQSSEDIKSQEANFRQAQLGYRLAGERYASGISSEVEVLDAEAAMSQAESGYLESILQYFSSMLKMKRLIGE